jgi:antitoxin CptB
MQQRDSVSSNLTAIRPWGITLFFIAGLIQDRPPGSLHGPSNEHTPMSQAQSSSDAANGDVETRRRRALYRSNYRGTKEMDWLLGKFAEARLPEMDDMALGHFEDLLALQDPELNVWILDPARITDRTFEGLIADIRAFHNIEGRLGKPMTGADR